MTAPKLRAERPAGEGEIDISHVLLLAKVEGRLSKACAHGRHVHDERLAGAALLQESRQRRNNANIVAIFPATHYNTVELPVSDHSIKSTHQLSTVCFPTSAKLVPLGAGRAAVVNPQDFGRAIGFEMGAGRTSHEPETTYVCKP
jgi:hypothetical protein